MNKLFACNYAVVRFLPYPETEEFANVGVVLMCPRLGYFDFRLETRRRDRVTAFFPELPPRLFPFGRKEMRAELARVQKLLEKWSGGKENQIICDTGVPYFQDVFRNLTRPREAVFRFSSVGTVMAANPTAELERLFGHFVERQFAQHLDYQEKVMTERVARTLREFHVVGYRAEALGNEDYRVTMPFVWGTSRGDIRGIKPLDLAKTDTTRIIEHGERWVFRVNYLREIGYNPESFLFPVRLPDDPRKEKYAQDIRDRLEAMKAKTVRHGERDQIVAFAEA